MLNIEKLSTYELYENRLVDMNNVMRDMYNSDPINFEKEG